MKVLVTGGAGFIGSHVVRRLLSEGHMVTVLDNASTGDFDNVPAACESWEMDVRSAAVIPRIMKARFDWMVHLAAQTTVEDSLADPAFDAMENIIGTVNILEAARKSDVQRVVFSSASAVYGRGPENKQPIPETQELAPGSFYGLSKKTVEEYLIMYQRLYGLNYIILRLADVYGEFQQDIGEGGIIGSFIKKIMAGNGITIYGNGRSHDFVYAGDVADGIYAALLTAEVNTSYNLSSGTGIDTKELVRLLEDVTWKKLEVSVGAAGSQSLGSLILDCAKAREKLGWIPRTSIKKGLKKTIKHFTGKD
ncbi:MAG: NAD-dependent epimerase/dehydratase family protein [Selenomonas sp.]|uniref:NAD-dependent epimerase/dehydratase family protein n=1 Tax=Selenomonas sp. TaxID=2053611 RepID=UPI0025FF4122|nr:NAD-dependent epimerase/dehydratase family protein [Selenomonas sp.]MCR5440457.1 NAD-dependent epimerase/dehydratase family protein [Selenomonas sp.]